jgi:hypothetical protein
LRRVVLVDSQSDDLTTDHRSRGRGHVIGFHQIHPVPYEPRGAGRYGTLRSPRRLVDLTRLDKRFVGPNRDPAYHPG